jgi:hypothetical protein
MNWAAIAGNLIELGAPTIGGVLAGPAGQRVGSVVGDILGRALNVDSTPEAVLDAAQKNPGALMQVDERYGAEVVKASLAAQKALFANEDGRGFFHHGWRPALSWLVGFMWLWSGMILPVGNAVFGASVSGVPWDMLVAFTVAWLTIYGGGHTAKEIMSRRHGGV